MSGEPKIERGVPIPPPAYSGRGPRDPFVTALRAMVPGDSVFTTKLRATVNSQVGNEQKRRPSVRFVRRKEGNGTRVWCVAAEARP